MSEDMITDQVLVLCSQEVVEREGIVTVISTSFIPEDAKAMFAIQTFNGTGGFSYSLLLHPKTCRVLAKIMHAIADEYEKRGGEV